MKGKCQILCIKSMLSVLLLIFYLLSEVNTEKIPRRIWSFWADGLNNIPFGLQLLISRLQQQCIQKNWNFTLLDESLAPLYVEQFRIFPKYQSKAHEADLFRMQLLIKYGGFWVDFGVLFVNGVDYFEHLSENKYVRNKFGNEPETYFCYTDFFGTNDTFVDQRGDTYLLSPGLQVTMMASIPQAKFLVQSLALFKQVLSWPIQSRQQKLRQYVSKNQIRLGTQFKFGYYLGLNIVFQAILQQKQRELDLTHNSAQRKLAVKQYKIWTINNDQVGVYQLAILCGFKVQCIAQLSISPNIDQYMKEKPVEGAISLKRIAVQIWGELIQRQIYHQNVTFPSYLDSFNYFWYLNIVCPNQHRIFKNSLVHKFLLKNNLTYNKKFQIDFQNLQLPIFQVAEFCSPPNIAYLIIFVNFCQRHYDPILIVLIITFISLTFKRIIKEIKSQNLGAAKYRQINNQEAYEAQLQTKQETFQVNDISYQR